MAFGRYLTYVMCGVTILCQSALAQFLFMPAKQLSVDNSSWTNLNAASSNTVQSTFDWIDANWGLMDADTLDGQHGSYYTDYADNAVSNHTDADTLDGQHGSYYTDYADAAVSNLVVHASNVQVDVSGFTRIPQTETNVQKVLDWADLRFGQMVFSSYAQTNVMPFLPGAQTRIANYHQGVVTTNVGNAFNPTTGVFTCVTPGWYDFKAHGRVAQSGPWPNGVYMSIASTNFDSLPPSDGLGDANFPYTSVGCSVGGNPGASTALTKYMQVGHTACVWLNTNETNTDLTWQHFHFAGRYMGPE